jgi:DNA-directed RNA polymerase subunit RPC12/RpoP
MPIPVICSGCQAKLTAPDAAAGKKVKCPKCGGVIFVEALVAFEVVEEDAETSAAATPKAAPPAVAKKPVPAVVEADDQPRKKKARVAALDDDDDEPPKTKKRKKQSVDKEGGVSLARHIIGAEVLVILLGVGGYIYYDKFAANEKNGSTVPTPRQTQIRRRNRIPTYLNPRG